jgi:peptide-methionine (S)-S-oxide reductase
MQCNEGENIMEKNLMTATLAGGCFWCLEAVFDQVKGVESVESGYAGGDMKNPSYREVCNGNTGHAEVVQIHYDGNVVSYQDLLNVFFGIHDPTTLNRQGADVGTQYRSAIFYHNEDQKNIAEQLIKDLEMQKVFDRPIVTQVVPLDKFYMAEDYHQEYFAKNPYQPYCQAVVSPKVSKFRKHFLELLKKEAA